MENLFKATFWQELITSSINWIVSELPGIIILTIIVFIAFRILRFTFKRMSKLLSLRASKNANVDTDEAVKRINTLTNILYTIVKVIIWTVYLMMILQKFKINIAPILASAGILGLAVGFGAQELVRDFISGFFIILENQIRAGDYARINGTGGLVEKIELRTVTLRDFSGIVHVFQNGKINTVSNMTKDWSAIVLEIGVAYKENPQAVMDIMQEVGEDLRNDPEFAGRMIQAIEVFGLDKFDSSAIVIKARLKTRPGDQWAMGREFRKRLKTAFNERNIEIPFPQTTIHWGDKSNPNKMEMKDENLKREA
ncbi:MAG: mechanosensitive ion channel family protein [Candidatus Neomarinimicrobiota bacterium]